ncbi:MAG: DEAD/DEAH box helicase [Candidatus Omnitrophica bacterium]|nr:DEAD/DEAH box helicase [Candidatus Omnitrophota bacterium]
MTNHKTGLDLLPDNLKAVLTQNNISSLYQPQIEALENGLLSKQNIVLAMPTASGKTLMAELAMLKTIFSKQGNCLYIVPLRALASEKFEEFTKKYTSLGLKIGIATGDFDYASKALTENDILIATAEKVDSLLRQIPDDLCAKLGCVIIDEIHYIGDPHRGPTLETVITRLQSTNSKLKIVGLSATIANAQDIADWLNARLVSSFWRPVDLKEGVYCQGTVKFADGTSKEISLEHTNDEMAALAIDCVKDNGQALVFVNTRRSAQAEARRIAKQMRQALSHEQKIALSDLAQQAAKLSSESTTLGKQLCDCMKDGVVFHHAGLNPEHRRLVEDNFKNNTIKVICATPTLAVGVNLPSRRVIIRGLYRYVSGAGMKPVSVMEYKQMSGRAGRPQYDTYGEAIIFAKSKKEQGDMFSNFIFADAEPIQSYLGNESSLRVHLLASIATGFITSTESAFEFVNKTFFSHQNKLYDLSEMIIEIISFLEAEQMVTVENHQITATNFGQRISRLYIDPISAVLIRDCLKNMASPINPLSALYLICSVPDMMNLSLTKADIEKVVPYADTHNALFELPIPFSGDYTNHLKKIKTVWLISRWIEEEKEDSLCNFFGTGPGDIHRFMDTADWMLYSTIELAKLFKIPKTKPLYDLRTQVRYGIKTELLELINLKGIGRARARNLFDKGFKTTADLAKAPLTALQKVAMIGKEIAQSIKQQTDKLGMNS